MSLRFMAMERVDGGVDILAIQTIPSDDPIAEGCGRSTHETEAEALRSLKTDMELRILRHESAIRDAREIILAIEDHSNG